MPPLAAGLLTQARGPVFSDKWVEKYKFPAHASQVSAILYPMRIDTIACPAEIEAKLLSKHQVTSLEVRQAILNNPRIRFAEQGYTEGEDVYAAFGQTFGGRYLSVFFVYRPSNHIAIIISARDMSKKERKAYGRK